MNVPEVDAALIAARVAAGAALLDEHVPGWWTTTQVRAIDTDRLTLDSLTLCVLGQVYGHFMEGLERISLNGVDNAHALGFLSQTNEDTELLDIEWRRLIERRRAGD